MNTSFHIESHSMQLRSAILLYGNGGHVDYATQHPVGQNSDNAPVILPGSALTQEELASAYQALLGKTPLQMLDNRTLAFNVSTLVFWSEPQVRTTYFDCPEPMGERSGPVPHPGLVFVWQDHGLSVFAVKGRKRPSLNTPLFKAPYMNVYAGGSICMGNVKVPKPEPGNISACEAAFFQSRFTHANHATQVQYPGGIYTMWVDLLASKANRFPEQALAPMEPVHGKQQFTMADLLSKAGDLS
ncbi:hypothetical protein A6M27_01765 [Acidithiobacillus thiooxidans]|jgi:PRTRC genetic system protein B|uniref:PRTRC system protein B n=1 Tax=Acidithiobacillus thiooxidans TaxID=930 RepID=A0A1C2JMR1_ACITH|nr:PRTRC system protein B [Acidithiobacillus thiooxidans]OCX67498.1 hypothetical protein A6P07_19915 [Acidithiobacillus thiooxidans]OCX73134.1 hypothetical protein A6O24_12530 [Acidithiobacillus thiooxidans]OCX81532.1 hypothetical protein A6O26_13135 [Acidithiobacillus thiooxidans]OCX89473.1 hypothetical protein A6M27_01765 [Acidithiobacillus thiooxidans]OFC50702.1 hypothetical protein BAE47_01260 [Acidithiobacillus thiooxidans]